MSVVIIGAGLNGLACAAALAKRGEKVTVLEARDTPGGLAGRRPFGEGYVAPGVLTDTTRVRAGLLDSLGLFGHGVKQAAAEDVLCATEEGPGWLLGPALEDELKGRAPDESAGYAQLRAMLDKAAPLLRDALGRRPPPLLPDSLGGLWDLGSRGLKLRLLGERDMVELLRVLPMCAADFLREYVTDETLCAGLALPACLYDPTGPHSAGTAARFLLDQAVADRPIAGGGPALVEACVAVIEGAQGRVQTDAEVLHIRVEQGRVKGVTLSDGTHVDADVVAAACHPRRALLDLLPPMSLPLAVEDEALHIRSRGTAAVVHLGLSAPLSFSSRPGDDIRAARVAPGIDAIERAFDDSKYRRLATRPVLELRDVTDAATCPDGHRVVTVHVGYAPHNLDGGWSKESKDTLLGAVLDELERVAPGTRDKLVHSELLSPVDLEDEYGLSGGHLLSGEHALDQLVFMRPTRSLARYRTPVEGLFLCGSGSHPGGGLTLAPGALCAEEMVRSA